MTLTIEASGLRKRFGRTVALDGLDLHARAGHVTAVLGPNGAGKTTFVRAVATLLRPDAGTLRVAGHDVAREPAVVRTLIGLAGQHAAVEPAMTGRENLHMIARLYGASRRSARRRSADLLVQLELADVGDRLVRTYSGGMRRRLDLGACLVGRPRLLLLDEPTTGLDPRSRSQLWDAVRDRVRDGTDVLLTTQYLDEADHLADHIVIIDHGRVVASDTPAELKRRLGGRTLEVHVRQREDLSRVADVLDALSATEPQISASTRTVSVAVDDGIGGLMTALRATESAGIDIDDIASRTPHLDEVFLTPDRQATRHQSSSGRGRTTGGGAPVTAAAAPAAGSGPWTSTTTIAGRALRRFVRTPQLIVVGTVQGAMFLLIFRYVFGGAIDSGELRHVDFLVPGYITTAVLFAGLGTATAVAEDLEQGFVDRLRSLPIPRGAFLTGRAVADTLLLMWSLVVTVAIGFAVGFRLGGSVEAALVAFGLLIIVGFAFIWFFIALGLVAGSPQAAQGMGLVVFPLTFVSSAYVPIETMPGWMQPLAEHQPLTVMINAVRALTQGPAAEALLGAPANVYIGRSLLWALGIVAVFGALAIAQYRRR